MSASKNNKATGTKGKFADVTFVNYSLTAKDKQELKKAVWTLDDLDSCLVRLAESGYKTSTQYDERNSCFTCFIIQREQEHENFGYICTGRGSTPHKAIKQAYYIGFHVLEGVFSNVEQYSSPDALDD